MKYHELEAIELTDDEVRLVKSFSPMLTMMVQRSNQVLIKASNTNAFFRGLLRRYANSSFDDVRNSVIVIKIVVAPHQVELYKGWLIKSIRTVLLEDISNSYAGDIKILPGQIADTGAPNIWRIRAGTKEHLIYRIADHISDIRRACNNGQQGIKISVEAGFDLWNNAEVKGTTRVIGGIEINQNNFTKEHTINFNGEISVAKNLIELFFNIYTLNLKQHECILRDTHETIHTTLN